MTKKMSCSEVSLREVLSEIEDTNKVNLEGTYFIANINSLASHPKKLKEIFSDYPKATLLILNDNFIYDYGKPNRRTITNAAISILCAADEKEVSKHLGTLPLLNDKLNKITAVDLLEIYKKKLRVAESKMPHKTFADRIKTNEVVNEEIKSLFANEASFNKVMKKINYYDLSYALSDRLSMAMFTFIMFFNKKNDEIMKEIKTKMQYPEYREIANELAVKKEDFIYIKNAIANNN